MRGTFVFGAYGSVTFRSTITWMAARTGGGNIDGSRHDLPAGIPARGAGVRPLAIDLFCGLGGWSEGLLAENYDVIGFDIERHVYGNHRYPAQLVLQDVLTLHGSQFQDAALIVCSPPCQEFSYMAMPWSLAKAKAKAIRADTSGKMLADLTALFNACFRIQAQASLAAGRHIPMVVENVRGAIPWVGRSRLNFGSYHFWGDVPALMPMTLRRQKLTLITSHISDGRSNYDRPQEGSKVPGFRFDGNGGSFQTAAVQRTGVKNGNDWFGAGDECSLQRHHGSKSSGRKMASAMIAKIPLDVSTWVARCFKPI
jgi:hypothetical protein